MRSVVVGFVCVCVVLSVPLVSQARHQVGGQLEMRAIGNVPGNYRIIVTNYFEAGPRADRQTSGNLGIFRKRDNALMLSFSTRETGQRQPIIYSNEFCAEQRNLNFLVATFEADIQLDPALYADAQGYYIAYQTGNRNNGINNLINSGDVGYTFYLEFPALQQNGRFVANSSPRFSTINGEYVCIGEPFTFAFGGTDPDGDELRYSMVTPLNKRGNGENPISPGPYPDVNWSSGFEAARTIPGNPTLRVDAQTGELSVTATALGLFVFGVRVEEYRNGVKIGEVRRDFQFLVIDCPPNTTPDPAVQLKNQPATARSATFCRGDSATLQATVDAAWNYQWRRDGVNLGNATGSSLTVRESGEYTVVVSQKAACSKTGNSQSVIINVVGNSASLSTTGHLCATTGSVRLTAAGEPGVTYQWYRNDQLLPAQTTDSLRVTEAGRYQAVLMQAQLGCVARTDVSTVVRSSAVQATIRSGTGQNRICPLDSLPLEGSGGLGYAWQRNGQPMAGGTGAQVRAKIAGSYVVTATDVHGCTGVSTPFLTVQLPTPAVLFDSIPPVCGPDVPAYILTGSPQGGDFAGTGLIGAEFSPKRAGIGNHRLTYSVKAAPECAGTVATRTAVVAPIPTIEMADTLTTYRGNTFELYPVLTGNPNRFAWAPPTYLDDATAAAPLVVAIPGDMVYTLAVSNSAGCEARDTIRIIVLERIWMPDAFSPNGDGLNDRWVLPGIDAFPDAIVTVFTRWGEVIYRSERGYPTPFDGTRNGVTLPPGIYTYTVRAIPDKPLLRGHVMLLR